MSTDESYWERWRQWGQWVVPVVDPMLVVPKEHAVLVNDTRVVCKPDCPSVAAHIDIPRFGRWVTEEELKQRRDDPPSPDGVISEVSYSDTSEGTG
jgi:hypothetical protein